MSDNRPPESPRFWRSGLLSSLPWLIHGVTERGGGTSSAPFDSLNLGLHVGDTAGCVQENRKRLAAAIGMVPCQMVCAEQVHGGAAAVVTAGDAGSGASNLAGAVTGVDALVTREAELLLTLFFADCLPIFLADKENQVIALVHAGWRGLIGGVIENTLCRMRERFGSHQESVIAAVGPGIGPCCFEVGPEVAAQFPSSVLHQGSDTKAHVNLPEAARLRLVQAGIPAAQVEVAGLCTACHTAIFFSHRRESGRTGRMGAFISRRI